MQGRVEAPADKAKLWLEDLVKHHLLQVATDPTQIEFHHQLFQEYYAAEYLLRQLDKLDDLTLKKLYLNRLDWTESLAMMLGILKNERQALRVVELALEIDLKLGARLAGAVEQQFQRQTVEWITGLDVPDWLKVELLGRTESDFAVDELLQQLYQNTADRHRVATALKRIGSKKVLNGLFEVAKEQLQITGDENSDICYWVTDAVGRIINNQAVEIPRQTSAAPVSQKQDVDISEMSLDVKVAQLIRDLNEKETLECWNAAAELGRIGNEESVAALLNALRHRKRSSLRWGATQGLKQIKRTNKYCNQVVAALIIALYDKKHSVRETVANALGEIGDERAVKPLIQTLRDSNSEVRESAIVALGKIGDEEAIEALLTAFIEDSIRLRYLISDALERIGNPKPLNFLWQLCCLGYSEAFSAISTIQERCRFYNYEIEQMALPTNPVDHSAASITNIYGGQFGDFVSGDKRVKIEGNYVEKQENI